MKMLLEGKKIGFALTGSFCTLHQVIPQMEKVAEAGASIIPIISYNIRDFDTRFNQAEELKAKLRAIAHTDIIETIVAAEPIGPQKLLDILLIAPCTGNTLAKLANAITDTPVLMAAKSQLRNQRPVVLAISTNDGLSNNAKNIGSLLNTRNVLFVPFGQDDSAKKNNSISAKMDLILPALELALEGKQMQPILLGKSEML